MRIIECKQGSPEWWVARAGIPSASNFDKIITPKTGKASSQQFGYLCELIAEKMMGGPPEGVEAYTNRAMQYGIDTEPEARAWYELETGNAVKQVGFCINDELGAGCSPDGLVGEDGGLELKCPMAKTHVAYLLAGGLPDEYKCQVHASLLVTGRKWWDFSSYCLGFPPFLIRVVPDEFTDAMGQVVTQFTGWLKVEYDKLLAMMPQMEPVTDSIEHQPF